MENEFTPIATQEDLDAAINEALKPYADYDAQKNRADTAEGKLLRYRIAHESGLAYELAERLQGKDEKELREDAKALAGLRVLLYTSANRAGSLVSTILPALFFLNHVYSFGIDMAKVFSGKDSETAEEIGMFQHVKFMVWKAFSFPICF